MRHLFRISLAVSILQVPLLILVSLLLTTAAGAGTGPSGHLIYIKGDAAYVTPAEGGPARRLPQSSHAWLASISPTDGTILLFVAPSSVKWTDSAITRGLISRPPYDSAQPLPPPLDKVYAPRVIWSGDGKNAYIDSEKVHGSYVSAAGRFQPLPYSADSVSRDGRVVAYATDREVRARRTDTGQERTLFSIGKPEPLFEALRQARHPEKLRDLLNTDPALWRNSNNWAIGSPAVTPDGKAIFFAANLGQGMGASGNTDFCFFAAEVATGKLSVLSKLGQLFGRIPGECQVSPDGQRLLFVVSAHSSAVDNPRSVYVVDLLTQESRELLGNDPGHKNQTNITDGVCWSPDGRYIAVSVLYYNAEEAMRKENWEPSSDAFTLLICDAATGHVVRRISGARLPSWSR